MEAVNSDIESGIFRQVYLLYGEETYLRTQFRNRLTDAIGRDADVSTYRGQDMNLREIIDLAETVPFMNPGRLIVIEDSLVFDPVSRHKRGSAIPDEDVEALIDYLKKGVAEWTHFIFDEPSINKGSTAWKAVSGSCLAVECAAQDDATLRKWVAGRVKTAGFAIAQDAVALFVDWVGTSMYNAANELDKLIAYCEALGTKRIEVSAVREIVTRTPEERVFDLAEAASLGHKQEALGIYYDLMGGKETPVGLLALIIRQWNILLRAKSLIDSGKRAGDLMREVKMPPSAAGRYMKQAEQMSRAHIERTLRGLADLDYAMKSGRIDPNLGLEMYICAV